jgi:hypothetical protein
LLAVTGYWVGRRKRTEMNEIHNIDMIPFQRLHFPRLNGPATKSSRVRMRHAVGKAYVIFKAMVQILVMARKPVALPRYKSPSNAVTNNRPHTANTGALVFGSNLWRVALKGKAPSRLKVYISLDVDVTREFPQKKTPPKIIHMHIMAPLLPSASKNT